MCVCVCVCEYLAENDFGLCLFSFVEITLRRSSTTTVIKRTIICEMHPNHYIGSIFGEDMDKVCGLLFWSTL